MPRAHPDPTRFVLVGTSHAGNVGAAARAMKVMGFSDLVLVAPRFADVLAHDEALAMASGATDVLARARVVATLAEALDGVTYVCATAMTPRDFGPPTAAPREHFADAGGSAASAWPSSSARERFGLANDDVYRCHACLIIPTAPGYGSLNLAQAVQLIAYDWRQALGGFAVEPRTADAGAGRCARRCRACSTHWQRGAGGDRLPRPGRAEEADAAPEPAAQPRPADRRGGAHPARHGARDRQGRAAEASRHSAARSYTGCSALAEIDHVPAPARRHRLHPRARPRRALDAGRC